METRGTLGKLECSPIYRDNDAVRRVEFCCVYRDPQGTHLSCESLLFTYKNSSAKSPGCGGPEVDIGPAVLPFPCVCFIINTVLSP